ncbi:hypothetical protein [Clostridium sp.]|uniref:tetratricopeptide repeat protein n=1 Tax=Clostridium sp. TaxID=1506 RepID=UPI0028424DB2|nr:hypothetical protein [Clostridium sp.]MDR3594278.1 hypothetical protein [Clostridium sp.]
MKEVKNFDNEEIKNLKTREAFERLDNGSDFMKEMKQKILEGQKLSEDIDKFYQRNMKGLEYEQSNDLDSAILEYEKNMIEFPNYNRPYFCLCNIYRKRKEYNKEIRVILNAFNNIPERKEYYENRLEKTLILKAKSEGVKIERRNTK